jgi:hypothetical protein
MPASDICQGRKHSTFCKCSFTRGSLIRVLGMDGELGTFREDQGALNVRWEEEKAQRTP